VQARACAVTMLSRVRRGPSRNVQEPRAFPREERPRQQFRRRNSEPRRQPFARPALGPRHPRAPSGRRSAARLHVGRLLSAAASVARERVDLHHCNLALLATQVECGACPKLIAGGVAAAGNGDGKQRKGHCGSPHDADYSEVDERINTTVVPLLEPTIPSICELRGCELRAARRGNQKFAPTFTPPNATISFLREISGRLVHAQQTEGLR